MVMGWFVVAARASSRVHAGIAVSRTMMLKRVVPFAFTTGNGALVRLCRIGRTV
jgi:hypothetical protein